MTYRNTPPPPLPLLLTELQLVLMFAPFEWEHLGAQHGESLVDAQADVHEHTGRVVKLAVASLEKHLWVSPLRSRKMSKKSIILPFPFLGFKYA